MQTTALSVQEMLQLPVFHSSNMISGQKGSRNMVRFIDILEVPDVKGWVREGEFLLTTAYSLRSDLSRLTDIVRTLSRSKAAALGIKLGRFIEAIPDEVIQVSQRLGFPIIQIDPEIPWIDITHAVMGQLLNRQEALLKTSNENYQSLLTEFLEEQGIQRIADRVFRQIQAPVLITDVNGNTIIASPEDHELTGSANQRSWAIRVNKRMVGYLYVDKRNFSDLDLVYIEQARFIFSLELMKRNVVVETERKLKGDLFDDVLSGRPLSEGDVKSKARQLNLDITSTWEVAIVEKEDTPAFSKFQTEQLGAAERMSGNLKNFYLKDDGSRLILLLPTKAMQNQKGERIFEAIRHFRTGIGRAHPLTDAHKSLIEAQQAMAIGTKLKRGSSAYFFHDMEMYHLLLEASNYVNFDSIIHDQIGRIIEYDRENGTRLLYTLYRYLAHGGNVIETAEELFIHRNTVKYRLNRIRDVMKIDFEQYGQQFILYLCCTLYFLKK